VSNGRFALLACVQLHVEFSEKSDSAAWFFRLATFALIVAVLRVADEVLIPVAFAVLLAFLLSPLVVRLIRVGLPRGMAIVLTVSVAFGAIGGIGWLVTSQAIALVRELPNYEENLRQKIAAIKHPRTPAMMERMSGMVENLRREIKSAAPDKPVTPPEPDEVKPVPVEVKASEPTPWELAREIVKPILRPLGVAGIVIVFVVAMLFQREDLRDRFLKIVSAGKLTVATQAIDDAAQRVSRYLGMQLIVNASYGVPIGLGLWWIGIPNALLWGLLATLLRFIPFIGPWIAAIFPVALAIAVDPGWTMILYTIGLFVVMELISNNIIEVVLYGASTGISNLALLVAAVFWTWVWGPAGLVLSTPLTVCVLVLGNYVPGMGFLSMLLGSQPALEPPAQFYQRMLSMESEDMFDVASRYIGEHSVEEFYEDIFIPALLMSEQDRHSGGLPEVRQRFIFQASHDLIDELERQDEVARLEAGGENVRDAVADATMPVLPEVLGIPARDEADEVVAHMMCHLLRRRGIAAALTPIGANFTEGISTVADGKVKAAFVSALPPSALSAARYICRRIRQRSPGAPFIVGLWRHSTPLSELREKLAVYRPSEIVITVSDALAQIEKLIGRREDAPPVQETPPSTQRDYDDGSTPPFSTVPPNAAAK
jgi:predicted PurR-regulated permease PerM